LSNQKDQMTRKSRQFSEEKQNEELRKKNIEQKEMAMV
jgi:hypothetical protein